MPSSSAVEAIEKAIKDGSIERLRSLDEQFPGALERVELPFHLATMSGAPSKVVRFLIERVPNKVSKTDWDKYENTALHAAKKGTCVSVVRLLLRHDPGLLQARNVYGWSFLHTAVRNGLPLKVIKLIVRRWPESVMDKTDLLRSLEPLRRRGRNRS